MRFSGVEAKTSRRRRWRARAVVEDKMVANESIGSNYTAALAASMARASLKIKRVKSKPAHKSAT